MKKIWITALVMMLLAAGIAGCTQAQEPATVPTQTAAPTQTTTAPTEVTAAPTQPTEPSVPVTEPTQPETTTPATQPGTEATEPTQPATDTTPCAHSYGAWAVQKAAACESSGWKERECTLCGETEQQTLAATGHSWDGGSGAAPADCSQTVSCTYTCKICGKTKTETVTGAHDYGEWEYEEYTYLHTDSGRTLTSHRKVRACTKCGYQEYGNTPDHNCTIGSTKHEETIIDEGSCISLIMIRSTCTVCGWYVDFTRGDYGWHTFTSETRHLSDYTEYTNELDCTVYTCTLCDYQTVSYTMGEGFVTLKVSDAYQVWMEPEFGFEYAIVVGDLRLLEHPEWQAVYRNLVYNEEGYLIQFDYTYCTKWGDRYTCTVDCSDIPGWFAEEGVVPPLEKYEGMRYHLAYIINVIQDEAFPDGWHIGWSG